MPLGSLSHSLSLSFSLSHSLSFSLSHTHSLSLSLILSPALARALSLYAPEFEFLGLSSWRTTPIRVTYLLTHYAYKGYRRAFRRYKALLTPTIPAIPATYVMQATLQAHTSRKEVETSAQRCVCTYVISTHSRAHTHTLARSRAHVRALSLPLPPTKYTDLQNN